MDGSGEAPASDTGTGGRVAEVVIGLFRLLERRDIDGVVDTLAEQGVFFDPHYPPPIGPHVEGRDAFRRAIEWAYSALDSFEFEVVNVFDNPDRPTLGAVEVVAHHRLAGGPAINVPQVFVAELDRDGRLLRLQSFCPYPPPAPAPA
ncbi:MAG TPA: nuclear transport factor 2 family protein [Acidimicrobiales bacterium]|nr:nuclear transport factor 2 family protein [Acidimicrobiales bacterium]